jgi:arginase
MARRKRIASLLAVHMDLGAGRRGVDMGPSAMRVAGLRAEIESAGWRVKELEHVRVLGAELAKVGSPKTRFLAEVLQVCTQLRDETEEALAAGAMPIVLGGDHSIAMGSVSGVARHYRREKKQPVGLIWVDAHTDMNLPDTTPSGNIHGMPLSHLLGHGVPSLRTLAGRKPAVAPEHVALLGIRSVDKRERDLVRATGVTPFTMSDIDRRGCASCVEEAIEIATRGTAGFHLSFDLDGIDPHHAPGVGTPVPGGLTYREAHLICEEVARSGKLLSLDMVELNPIIDERNITGKLAVELIASCLGKRTL